MQTTKAPKLGSVHFTVMGWQATMTALQFSLRDNFKKRNLPFTAMRDVARTNIREQVQGMRELRSIF